jgi:phosphonate C-P lyase system protein PhnH
MLQAISTPGIPRRLEVSEEMGTLFTGMPTFIGALALTLLDAQVQVAACGNHAESWVRELCSVTGGRGTAVEEADYVFSDTGPSPRDLRRFKQGDLIRPEDGATVFVWLNDLIQGDTGEVRMAGPGISSSRSLRVSGPMLSLAARRADVRFEYPMGFDLFAVGSDGNLLGLPRTASVELLPGREI